MAETKSEDELKNKKVQYGVLRPSLGGGPHGLGDPDDKFLRKVEKDILIAKIVRTRSRKEKCIPEVEEFSECCKEAQFAMPFYCRKQNEELKQCLEKWYKDESFWEECTQQYLNERSEYRRTGIPKKAREGSNRMGNIS